MFKRGSGGANKDSQARDLSEEEMMFMGIYGKEMTKLELFKREEQDLLARKIMCHHQQNYLRGYGPTDSGGPLTPERANSSFKRYK